MGCLETSSGRDEEAGGKDRQSARDKGQRGKKKVGRLSSRTLATAMADQSRSSTVYQIAVEMQADHSSFLSSY